MFPTPLELLYREAVVASGEVKGAAVRLGRMSQSQWTAVDHYLSDLLVGSDPVLDAALAASSAAGLPQIQVTPNLGKLLHILAQMQGARTILEIGTLGGYSTIWLARALPRDGQLITLESSPQCVAVARENLARAGLADIVDVRLGLALDTLPQLASEGRGPFDLIFIDADKASTADYFAWALALSRPGTLIIVDNVIREGAIIDAGSADASVQGVRRFLEAAAAEPRANVTAIQTVGSKGYDGFAVVRVQG
jgi:predicted O-methyltransferase YrrM